MKRFFFVLILIFFFFLFINKQFNLTLAQNRYATCDQCGFCPVNLTPPVAPSPPSNWPQCVQCLYPNASTDPNALDTLKIDPNTNLPPTPFPGVVYTMIGCVQTNLGSFQREGAAASVVQVLLDLLFKIIGGIALVYFIYGLFVIMTSQANPERLNYGKRIAFGAIVGLIFSLSSVFLVNLLANGILKIPGFEGQITPTPTP